MTEKIKYSIYSTGLIIYLLMLSVSTISQNALPKNFCISNQEKVLYNKINQLIEDYGNPAVELSASLSYVAGLHVDDLLKNRPDTSVCNLSSWSDKGSWTPCCHNPYVPQQDCMWDKPKELTPYPFRGYELVSYYEGDFNTDSIMNLWSGSKKVLDMLLTKGDFKKKKWVCMGVGINDEYVSVWFGQRADRLKKPDVCDESDFTAPEPVSTGSIEKFYVIFGSYRTTKDAKEAIKRLNKNGFDGAGMLKSGDKIRVYLNNFTNIKEATLFKQNLPYTYREAWIYKE